MITIEICPKTSKRIGVVGGNELEITILVDTVNCLSLEQLNDLRAGIEQVIADTLCCG